MRWLFVFFLLAAAALAQPAGFTHHIDFEVANLKVHLVNYEQPRNKPYLIVHFEVRNPTDSEQRCDWAALVSLRRGDGTSMAPNYDVLVDSGHGMSRATGPFIVAKRGKATASVLFMLGQGDLPGFLELPDGRRSMEILERGKTRWTP